jgi:hypothetical protein
MESTRHQNNFWEKTYHYRELQPAGKVVAAGLVEFSASPSIGDIGNNPRMSLLRIFPVWLAASPSRCQTTGKFEHLQDSESGVEPVLQKAL